MYICIYVCMYIYIERERVCPLSRRPLADAGSNVALYIVG